MFPDSRCPNCQREVTHLEDWMVCECGARWRETEVPERTPLKMRRRECGMSSSEPCV